MRNNITSNIFLLIFLALVLYQCRKDEYITRSDAKLKFSADTVTFDTIFTTIGSTTKNFRVYNPYKQSLRINSIRLANGEDSKFRMNVDGQMASHVEDIELFSNDSMFIFIEVTLDPVNSNDPMVILDSVLFETNGNQQNIKLVAFGQDVHLINGELLNTQTWTADKPYLVYNSMAIDENEVLTIQEGVRVHFHSANSSMLVLGTLKVEGTKDNPVIFQGDRLEDFYDNIPGQWGTIVFFPGSKNNEMDYAIIKNAVAGMQVGFYNDYSVPGIIIRNTLIQNMSFAGIYAFGAKIDASNSVIAYCSNAALALLRGGEYNFYQCTISNLGDFYAPNDESAVVISNRIIYPELDTVEQVYYNVEYTDDLTKAFFSNSIIYGSMANELVLADNGVNMFEYKFDHCIIKNNPDSVESNNAGRFNEVLFNKNPKFISVERDKLNLQLDTLSPAKDIGDPALLLLYPYLEFDIIGNSRIQDGMPDLGAYERTEIPGE
ncbi:MAG: hypothetical protein JXJ22_12765 [Bacteroidales bacterium]|nr:hypothetical protein [Bacteroidales bacterium]